MPCHDLRSMHTLGTSRGHINVATAFARKFDQFSPASDGGRTITPDGMSPAANAVWNSTWHFTRRPEDHAFAVTFGLAAERLGPRQVLQLTYIPQPRSVRDLLREILLGPLRGSP